MTGFSVPPSDAGVIRAAPCPSPCAPTTVRWILAATILASTMAFIRSIDETEGAAGRQDNRELHPGAAGRFAVVRFSYARDHRARNHLGARRARSDACRRRVRSAKGEPVVAAQRCAGWTLGKR